jgi:hypothetical protein
MPGRTSRCSRRLPRHGFSEFNGSAAAAAGELVVRRRRGRVTTQQLHLFNGLAIVFLVVVALSTRATARRVLGALAGGAAAGVTD